MPDNRRNMLVSKADVYGSGFLQDGVLLALICDLQLYLPSYTVCHSVCVILHALVHKKGVRVPHSDTC